jgi:hypothetical protein
MSKDLSTVLDTATSHASTHADDALSNALTTAMNHVSANPPSPPDLSMVLSPTGAPLGQGPEHAGNATETAAMHIDTAEAHTTVTLPDLVTLTGHDWFGHV